MIRLLATVFAAWIAMTAGGCARDMNKDEMMKKEEMMKKDKMKAVNPA